MLFINHKKLKLEQKALIIVILIFLFEFQLPNLSLAAQINAQGSYKGPVLVFFKQDTNFKIGFDFDYENSQFTDSPLVTQDKKPKKIQYIKVTGYSSTPDQTDSTPFITANGKRVYDGLVATNCLPFGTQVKFPEYFGDKEFTVNDRMHPRYPCSADIWFPTRAEACELGVRYLKMEVY